MRLNLMIIVEYDYYSLQSVVKLFTSFQHFSHISKCYRGLIGINNQKFLVRFCMIEVMISRVCYPMKCFFYFFITNSLGEFTGGYCGFILLKFLYILFLKTWYVRKFWIKNHLCLKNLKHQMQHRNCRKRHKITENSDNGNNIKTLQKQMVAPIINLPSLKTPKHIPIFTANQNGVPKSTCKGSQSLLYNKTSYGAVVNI